MLLVKMILLIFIKRINNYLNLKNNHREELFAEPKIDGISASLKYADGNLVQGYLEGRR